MGRAPAPARRLSFALCTIVFAWLTLLSTAYVIRFRLGRDLPETLFAIGICYAVLALAAMSIIGLDASGALAAAGMLVPAIVAGILAMMR